jgi:hypothetical protein
VVAMLGDGTAAGGHKLAGPLPGVSAAGPTSKRPDGQVSDPACTGLFNPRSAG